MSGAVTARLKTPPSGIPTSEEFGISLADYPAPYSAHGDVLLLAFRVSRDRLTRIVRPPYSPRPLLGKYAVMVEVNRFYSVGGSGRGRPMDPYNEVVYYAPVYFEGRASFLFFKLYLDRMEPVILGRELFGYPKEMAEEFSFEISSSRLRAEALKAGRSVLEIEASRTHGFNRAIPFRTGLFRWALNLAVKDVPVAALYPDDGHVILSSFDKLGCSNGEFVSVTRCRIGEYEDAGLFSPGESPAPIGAVFVKDLVGSMGEPVRRIRASS